MNINYAFMHREYVGYRVCGIESISEREYVG